MGYGVGDNKMREGVFCLSSHFSEGNLDEFGIFLTNHTDILNWLRIWALELASLTSDSQLYDSSLASELISPSFSFLILKMGIIVAHVTRSCFRDQIR